MPGITIASADYQRAKQKAKLNRLLGALMFKPHWLVSLAEAAAA